MSKNNFNERLRKMQPKQDHYSIRKFTVGAASVLIGISFLGMTNGQNVKADVLSGQSETEVESKKDKQDKDSNSEQKSTDTENNKSQDKSVEQNKQSVEQQKTAASDEDKTKLASEQKNDSQSAEQDNKKANAANKEQSASKQKIDLQSGDELADKSGKAVSSSTNSKTDTDKSDSSSDNDSITLSFNPKSIVSGKLSPDQLKASDQEETPTTASDWESFVNAVMDPNCHIIKLNHEIDITGGIGTETYSKAPIVTASGSELNFGGHSDQLIHRKWTGTNIARTLTIDGNGNTINFGKYYISFTDNNQQNGTPWDLTFKDVTIKANGNSSGAYSPFYMGDVKHSLLEKNKVTFDGVTADIKNGAFYSTTTAKQISDSPYTTATFEGINNITCEGVNVDSDGLDNYSSAVMASHIIFANGTTNFYVSTKKSNNDTNAGGDILRAKVEDSKDTEAPIIIEEGATVNLNVPTKDVLASDIHATDVRGILVNNALKGTVVVNGTLNADMQKGHSTAIWAGSLEIGKNGTVNINTQQDNQADGTENAWINGVTNYNGLHYAPISLGVGFAQNLTSADSHLTDNGTLKIVRNNTGKTLVPLIAFGSGGANPSKYNITVGDGATLDLEDNSTTFDSVLSGTKQRNTPPAGMITMFGTSSKDSFTLDNPGYVNFERNNKNSSLRGNFTRFEGTTNATWLNGPSASNAVTPIVQWDAGDFDSPSFVWYVKQLHTQN